MAAYVGAAARPRSRKRNRRGSFLVPLMERRRPVEDALPARDMPSGFGKSG
jgi:hypothetical protein